MEDTYVRDREDNVHDRCEDGVEEVAAAKRFFSGDDAQQRRSGPRPSNVELRFSLPPLMAALWRSAHDKVPCMPTYRTPEAASHNDRQEWQPWAGIREMREQTRAGKGEILLLNMPILVFVSQFHICPFSPIGFGI